MKRIATLPTSLKITEATLPDWHLVPRSGKENSTASFPCEKFTGDKYPTFKFTAPHWEWYASQIDLSFEQNTQGVYEGTLVCKGISKGSYSQANDKLYTYDKDTGAHFSMDMEDVFNLIMGMTQSRHTVTADGRGYEISGKFIMRWHFLSPYTEEIEASFIKKLEDKKNAIKPKLIVPSKDKLYIAKDGAKWMFLGKAEYKNTYKRIRWGGYRGNEREWYDEERSDEGNLFLYIYGERDGMIASHKDFRVWKPTTILSIEDAPVGTFEKCMEYLLMEGKDYDYQKEDTKMFILHDFGETHKSLNHK